MTLSLRGRLLIGVISLVAVGLLVSDVATYLTLQSSLVSRIDDQLTKPSTVAWATSVLAAPLCQRRGPGSPGDLPGGTIIALIAADGSVVNACGVGGVGTTGVTGLPVLPKSLPAAHEGKPAAPYTVEGTGAVSKYRMTNWPESFFGAGQVVVLAIPLTPVQSTLS